MKTALSVLTLAATFACSGKTLTVSDDLGVPAEGGLGAASGTSAGSGVPGSTGCQTVAEIQSEIEAQFAPSSVASQHVGRWDGFIAELHDPYIPSDIVSLEISADGTSTLMFGTNPPPPPPTSADEGYLCLHMPSDPCIVGPYEGIHYELGGIQSKDSRLQFVVRVREPWNAWCAMQTPTQFTYYDEACSSGVGPDPQNYSLGEAGCTVTAPNGSLIALDCDYLATLLVVNCRCGEDGCLYEGGDEVDVALFDEGRAMIGTIGGRSVQFRRVTDPSQLPTEPTEGAPEASP